MVVARGGQLSLRTIPTLCFNFLTRLTSTKPSLCSCLPQAETTLEATRTLDFLTQEVKGLQRCQLEACLWQSTDSQHAALQELQASVVLFFFSEPCCVYLEYFFSLCFCTLPFKKIKLECFHKPSIPPQPKAVWSLIGLGPYGK